jgi:hypothetical protein
MIQIQELLLDRRVRFVGALLLTLILVACQGNDGGGGGAPAY